MPRSSPNPTYGLVSPITKKKKLVYKSLTFVFDAFYAICHKFSTWIYTSASFLAYS